MTGPNGIVLVIDDEPVPHKPKNRTYRRLQARTERQRLAPNKANKERKSLTAR